MHFHTEAAILVSRVQKVNWNKGMWQDWVLINVDFNVNSKSNYKGKENSKGNTLDECAC